METKDFYPVEFSREDASLIRKSLIKYLRTLSPSDDDFSYDSLAAYSLLSKIENNYAKFRFDYEIPLDPDYCPPVIFPIIPSCASNDDD